MSCFPRTSLKEFPRPIWCQRQNGGIWVFSRVKDGYITWSINPVCVFARMSKTCPNMCHLYCCYCWYSCSWLLFIIEPHILLFRRPLAQSQWLQNHKLKELWKLDTIWRCLRDAGCTPDQLVNIIRAAACVLTILWVRLSSLCLISALTER